MSSASSPLPPPAPELVLPHARTLSVGTKLGRGSVATVYRAVLEGAFRTRRPVAAKVFDRLATDERDAAVTALARAVRHAAAVQHPNVAVSYDFALISNAQPVIVSELVEGISLAGLLSALAKSGRRMSTDAAIFVAHEVAEALDGAREARTTEGVPLHVLHHGLSTSNVILSWHGEVKVTDFGLATALRGVSMNRRSGDFLRRLSTIAPEVAQGSRGDARSDVFALGILLREMLVGPRFPEPTTEAQASAWVGDGHVEGRLLDPLVPAPLGPIVERALAFDPSDRYAHAGSMGFELRRACLSMGVGDGRIFLRSLIEDTCGMARYASSEATQPTKRIPAELLPSDSESRLALSDASALPLDESGQRPTVRRDSEPMRPIDGARRDSEPTFTPPIHESGPRLAMQPIDSEPHLASDATETPDHVTVHRVYRDH